jgi:DNA mismatch repair protein MutS
MDVTESPAEENQPVAINARKLTPAMERYMEVKHQHPDAIVLFRMGDFYELFYEDAEIAARVLNITLTSRDKSSTQPIPMAGFPYHALEGYLQKLIKAGHRAAICEQMEDPKLAKGPVRRDVTRIVTPGTLTDDALLEPREHNFLAAVIIDKNLAAVSWVEISTGEYLVTDVELSELADVLAGIGPAEILIPDEDLMSVKMESLVDTDQVLITRRPIWEFVRRTALTQLHGHFGVKSLEGFGVDESQLSTIAAGALLIYLQETQKTSLGHLTRLRKQAHGEFLLIDEATRRSLELTRTLRHGERDGSLIATIDQTVTAMGARLLHSWMQTPPTTMLEITARHEAVEELTKNPQLLRDLRAALQETYDLQRLTSRVATARCSPRDLASLGQTLARLPRIKALLTVRTSSRLNQLEQRLDLCPELRADIETCIVDEPPNHLTDGGVIRPGYHAQLDEFRELARGGKAWIAKYQAEESERIGIPNLKVGYNKVFGYYLEVTAANQTKVPADYIRKQTLKNQERYITPALKEYEDKVLSADQSALNLEQELFQHLRDRLAQQLARLLEASSVLAEIDVLTGLASLAVSRGYIRPEMTMDPIMDVREGRHPVLDQILPTGEFVPNDIHLGDSAGRVQIITGPNMAGKSTYIRQTALITILAQMGSFVPASEARIGITDRIFARVGASDELGKGQSTFMVEMTETAKILHNATSRSVVILDEIGRGTSTYDGLSLAWSITEYLHDEIGCRTLFATHYHELAELTLTLSGAKNLNVAVMEQDDNVTFLHRIVDGAAGKSYGIHVAKLAGLPRSVLDRARKILETLETNHIDAQGKPNIPQRKKRSNEKQMLLFPEPVEHPILEQLRGLNIDSMTPLDALMKLHDLRKNV